MRCIPSVFHVCLTSPCSSPCSPQHLRETQLLLCDTDGSKPLANAATSVSPLTALNLLNVMFLRADSELLKHGSAFRQFSAALASPPDERPSHTAAHADSNAALRCAG